MSFRSDAVKEHKTESHCYTVEDIKSLAAADYVGVNQEKVREITWRMTAEEREELFEHWKTEKRSDLIQSWLRPPIDEFNRQWQEHRSKIRALQEAAAAYDGGDSAGTSKEGEVATKCDTSDEQLNGGETSTSSTLHAASTSVSQDDTNVGPSDGTEYRTT